MNPLYTIAKWMLFTSGVLLTFVGAVAYTQEDLRTMGDFLYIIGLVELIVCCAM